MAESPLEFYNRYTHSIEREKIYGEAWLRRAYGNPLGRMSVWLFARRRWFSAWYGWKMRRPESSHRILPFVAEYELKWEEFVKSPFDYKTFNEFFHRALRPGSRPITAGEEVAVFPADGRHLAFPNVDTADGFYVKGAGFDVADLFDEAHLPPEQRQLTRDFAGGAMLISRLCPVDYHRFHFPVAGTPGESKPVRGWLHSVSPIALRRNIRYLVQNKREITVIESPTFGRVAMVEVGATNVGAIRQSFLPGRAVAKGDEKGLFAYGGSCVITIFQKSTIVFDGDLLAQSAEHRELYARMGDRLGRCVRVQVSPSA